ncbi:MAG: hypothetical protein ACQETP_07620 [Bacteroidota bacterium]
MRHLLLYLPIFVLLIGATVVMSGCDSTDAMDEDVVLEGQLLNATDRPVRNATVSLSDGNQTATTDDEGAFTLTVEPVRTP